MNIKGRFIRDTTVAVCLFGAFGAHADSEGAAYTMTNAADNNQVVVFSRNAGGLLTKTGVVPTGGKGAGGEVDSLGSQGSLVLASGSTDWHGGNRGDKYRDDGWLLVVNAGSNDISVFKVVRDGIELKDRMGSGGTFPVSLTVFGDRVYVLNEGAPANISGFKLDHDGHLTYLPKSTRLLGGGTYGQVAFDQRRQALVVTDKGNNTLLAYRMQSNGLPAVTPVVSPSSGSVPFGVTFDREGHLLVVEAGNNAVSSYNLLRDGKLRPITVSAPNGQMATCWIIANQSGDVITTNPGTHSLSAFHVDAATGQVSLLNGTAGAGNTPLDIDLSNDGEFAYAVDPSNGGVDMFKIEEDGSLTSLGTVDGGLSPFAQGMAAR